MYGNMLYLVASGTPFLMLASLRLCFLNFRVALNGVNSERWISLGEMGLRMRRKTPRRWVQAKLREARNPVVQSLRGTTR